MLQIAFIVAICYAVADWRYVRSGGKRVSRAEKRVWIISLGLISLVSIGILCLINGLPAAEDIGQFATNVFDILAVILMLAFMLHEGRRWRVRREHPLSEQK